MENRRLTLIVLSAVIACLAASDARAEVPDFAEYVPGDCLFYAGMPYSKEYVTATKKSEAYKFSQNEEVVKLLEEMFESVPMELGEVKEIFAKSGLTWKDLFALQLGGVALALDVKMIQVKMPKDAGDMPGGMKMPMMPRVNVAVYLDKSNGDVKAVWGKMEKLLNVLSEGEKPALKKASLKIVDTAATFYKPTDPSVPPMLDGILVFEKGDITVLSTSKAFAAEIIGCINGNGKNSLAKNDLYIKTMAKLGDKRMSTMFFNMKETLSRFGGMMKRDKDAETALKIIQLESLQAIGGSGWVDENGAVSQFYMYCPDGKFALLKPFQYGRAKFATLNGVGKNALGFISVSLNPAKLYDDFLAMVKAADADAYKEALENIAEAEKEAGFKIKDDLLASLGGEVTLVMTSATLQLDVKELPVPLAVIIELKDRDKFEKAYKAICKSEKIKPEVRKYGEKKHEIQVLPKGAVCITGKYFMAANCARTLEGVLDTMDGEGGKVVDTDHYKKAMKMLGGEPSFLFFLNYKEYGNLLESLGKMMPGMMRPPTPMPDMPDDMEDMDDAEEAPTGFDEGGTTGDEKEEWEEEEEMPEVPEMPDPMKMMETVSRFWKLFSDHFPGTYMSVHGDKEGLMLKFAMP
ncbi:MAG: hypothetical protein DRP79_00215 [Planctomycetota bacterium]|nr:MAG: hypothetical protein DRP79_00215 [Planctomycetota bacterium]